MVFRNGLITCPAYTRPGLNCDPSGGSPLHPWPAASLLLPSILPAPPSIATVHLYPQWPNLRALPSPPSLPTTCRTARLRSSPSRPRRPIYLPPNVVEPASRPGIATPPSRRPFRMKSPRLLPRLPSRPTPPATSPTRPASGPSSAAARMTTIAAKATTR